MTAIGAAVNGDLSAKLAAPLVTLAGRCLDGSFSISNPNGATSPPVLCGQLSGEHVYVDSSQDCNVLTMSRSPGVTGAFDWLIKVTQLRCDFANLSPPGCTQWHFGSLSGVVQTFNFGSGLHLAEQDQLICIRREANTCRICYAPDIPADFQLSGPGLMGITDSRLCCDYGIKGLDTRY